MHSKGRQFAMAIGTLAGCFLLSALCGTAAQVQPAPAGDLVRRAVENETKASNDLDKYMFCERKEGPAGSQTRLLIQTNDAIAALVLAYNDHPIGAKKFEMEKARLDAMAHNPDELRKKKKQETDDAERVTRIVRALPDAFLYEYDGTEPGRAGVGKPGDQLARLKFRPNPHYEPPTRVEQVLTGMEGTILVDATKYRIARIDGTLGKEVSFGWGILGHLDRGGHFLVEQGEVDKSHWDITSMDLAFTGKILWFKKIDIKSHETYNDFRREETDLPYAKGVELLKQRFEQLVAERSKKVTPSN